MKSTLIKSLAVVLVVAALSSCYGPFRLTNKLHAWNGQVSDLQELYGLKVTRHRPTVADGKREYVYQIE